jgi:lysozyme family protein
MNENFEASLANILLHEGLWSDHASDPGGATMKGVTLKVYRAWWKAMGKPGIPGKDELRNIPDATLAQIYRQNYWRAAPCDKLPSPIDLMVFDSAVNQGPGRAARVLQQAAKVTVDGAIGPKTLKAVRTKFAVEPRSFLAEVAARRMRHYGGLSTFKTFGLGWSRHHSPSNGKAMT